MIFYDGALLLFLFSQKQVSLFLCFVLVTLDTKYQVFLQRMRWTSALVHLQYHTLGNI